MPMEVPSSTERDTMAVTTNAATTVDRHWLGDAALDRLRDQADPLADNAVGAYFWSLDQTEPADLFARLAGHTHLPAERQDPAIRTFFEDAAGVPSWADPDKVRRGQEFFIESAGHHFSALYLASLPTAYAAATGVQVLDVTARLRTDAERRVNETAQLLMDVSGPAALEAGGLGVQRLLHVRLMHAAVRWLIGNDPAVDHVADTAPPFEPAPKPEDDPIWSASWGRPVNQEDLVATFLTFTTVVYDVFDRVGVDYTDDQIDDHLHMWRLIAHWLGVDPAIVPVDRPTAAQLQRSIWARQHAPSAAGVAMTAALLEQADDRLPRLLAAMIPTAMRRLNGDLVCDMIGVPPPNWTRFRLGAMSDLWRVLTFGRRPNAAMRRLSARTGRLMIEALVDAPREGERPAFEIPAHLAGRLAR